jgi:hypothetical protein
MPRASLLELGEQALGDEVMALLVQALAVGS